MLQNRVIFVEIIRKNNNNHSVDQVRIIHLRLWNLGTIHFRVGKSREWLCLAQRNLCHLKWKFGTNFRFGGHFRCTCICSPRWTTSLESDDCEINAWEPRKLRKLYPVYTCMPLTPSLFRQKQSVKHQMLKTWCFQIFIAEYSADWSILILAYSTVINFKLPLKVKFSWGRSGRVAVTTVCVSSFRVMSHTGGRRGGLLVFWTLQRSSPPVVWRDSLHSRRISSIPAME